MNKIFLKEIEALGMRALQLPLQVLGYDISWIHNSQQVLRRIGSRFSDFTDASQDSRVLGPIK